MLFITNRAINESLALEAGRKITFSEANNQAGQAIYFCRRNGFNDYTEVGSPNLLAALKASPAEQILLYFHGFNNQPEDDIFKRTQVLQELFDAKQPNLVQVIPLIWPCNDQFGVIRDYFDDQDAADASSIAYYRLLEKFLAWQEKNVADSAPCLKRINVLAHSMGNRVLRGALERWGKYIGNKSIPLIFRNTFLVAADIVNESLEQGANGDYICQSSRNVVVYFASDDLALRSSKAANVANKVVSRRLGHSGPESPDVLPRNVYSVDCDEINNLYDNPKGHSYFLKDDQGQPGLVFQHIQNAIITGRVEADKDSRHLVLEPEG